MCTELHNSSRVSTAAWILAYEQAVADGDCQLAERAKAELRKHGFAPPYNLTWPLIPSMMTGQPPRDEGSE